MMMTMVTSLDETMSLDKVQQQKSVEPYPYDLVLLGPSAGIVSPLAVLVSALLMDTSFIPSQS